MTNNLRLVVVMTAACLLPLAASAQQEDEATAQTPQNRGPMIVERVHSGFLVAPDVKVTRIDRKTSELAGAYAGWITDDTLFIGGGGYVLANGSHDRRMAYGGLVVSWMGGADRTIGYSLKTLLGGGQATLTDSFTELVPVLPLPSPGSTIPIKFTSQVQQFRFRQEFFIAEPEANVLIRLGRNVHVTAGAGYRFIGTDRWNDNGYRLRGATGTIGVQIGGGS